MKFCTRKRRNVTDTVKNSKWNSFSGGDTIKMDWLLSVQIGPKEVILSDGLVAVGSDWTKRGDTA